MHSIDFGQLYVIYNNVITLRYNAYSNCCDVYVCGKHLYKNVHVVLIQIPAQTNKHPQLLDNVLPQVT